MATNLAIDDKLLEEARLVGKHATKKAVVNEALAEYIHCFRPTCQSCSIALAPE